MKGLLPLSKAIVLVKARTLNEDMELVMGLEASSPRFLEAFRDMGLSMEVMWTAWLPCEPPRVVNGQPSVTLKGERPTSPKKCQGA